MVGGSERQNYLIGEYCENDLRNRGVSSRITPGEKQHFVNQFRSLKKRLSASHDVEDDPELLQLSYGNLRVKLTPEVIRNAYNEAMSGALQGLSVALRPWSTLGDDPPLKVIVAGGTARSSALREDVASMCERFDLDSPDFAEQFGSTGRYRFVFISPLYPLHAQEHCSRVDTRTDGSEWALDHSRWRPERRMRRQTC